MTKSLLKSAWLAGSPNLYEHTVPKSKQSLFTSYLALIFAHRVLLACTLLTATTASINDKHYKKENSTII